jgi:hypothetical protein
MLWSLLAIQSLEQCFVIQLIIIIRSEFALSEYKELFQDGNISVITKLFWRKAHLSGHKAVLWINVSEDEFTIKNYKATY